MTTGHSLKILVVDDIPAMRKIYCGMLEEAGFQRIEEAEDADSAWQMIQNATSQPREAFELIIADWNMPGASGVELLRAIRSAPMTHHLPFLIVTARGSQSHILEAMQAGANGYIVKPFSSDDLFEKISALFAIKRQN